MYKLCIVPRNIDYQTVISVESVGLINVDGHRSPTFTTASASLSFCHCARRGSWETLLRRKLLIEALSKDEALVLFKKIKNKL